ncbi:hypothetical protein AYJ57_00165 [Salipiger sp. CCB-MM3]|uniref:SoxR reducing system RseC family protein n=1 Tax=Salipiger sp. CCB-MM3 TaxID=1792508 RepID=UPI00080AABBB|nr:SoxR reducing system RseC family protein [Salipiger sp. CCB-MM3]ANT58913.1 hypothetical protein AYJ57_00165 [Salipiger sp. CCB-MM3]
MDTTESNSPSDTPGFLRETLRVIGARDGQIELELRRTAGCAACAVRETCGPHALTEMAAARKTHRTERLVLPHAGPAQPGDSAVVVMPSAAFLGAAGLMYLLPVLMLVLCVSLCSALGISDALAAALCIPALAVSFLPFRASERRGRLAAGIRIERIIPARSRA